jgi:DNA invertase Pin-like site-specific DNA recombinase
MTRCVLYARVSTKEQDCTRQLVELRQVAENHGWIIVDEYVDAGISGAKKNRPELDRMMLDAITRKFEMVATLELSRIGRNTKNLLDVVETLKEKNINLYIHNQRIDSSTASGSLFFTIASSFAQYERDLIRERVISGLENAKRKGVVLGRKTNLTPTITKKIIEMKSKDVGLKRIATECAVAVKTVRNVLAGVA